MSILPKNKNKKASTKLAIISENAPFQYVEAYKSLRTNLEFMAVDQDYRKILVTSAIPGEGKSNVAVNLSVSLAESGKKVLLVDCDLRKSTLNHYLNIPHSAPGLTSVLSGTAAPGDAITHFMDLGIDVLTAGAVPPNPVELLGSRRMGALIATLEQQYHYIILDTPPVSVVTDAAVLGRYVDGALLVVRQGHARLEAIELAQKALQNVNIPIIGAVFNGYDIKKSTRDTGYYYAYDYEYSKEDKA